MHTDEAAQVSAGVAPSWVAGLLLHSSCLRVTRLEIEAASGDMLGWSPVAIGIKECLLKARSGSKANPRRNFNCSLAHISLSGSLFELTFE